MKKTGSQLSPLLWLTLGSVSSETVNQHCRALLQLRHQSIPNDPGYLVSRSHQPYSCSKNSWFPMASVDGDSSMTSAEAL